MEQQATPLTGKRLLIAEDEPIIAMDYAAILTSAGAHIVATATTATEAIAQLQHIRVDAAVLDFVLADRNSDPLQAVLNEKGIPFVVVSAYPPVLVRSSGAQQILHKPISAIDLCAAVKSVCEAQR